MKLALKMKSSDMKDSSMQQFIVDTAETASERFDREQDIAQHVKKTLDDRFTPSWHVIVGKSFGSFVTHESGHFTYFYLNNLAFLIFKSG
tara:strand:- start:277 stop:546 length:270 start_codon:yes stop_codon:yes gene_type:complete